MISVLKINALHFAVYTVHAMCYLFPLVQELPTPPKKNQKKKNSPRPRMELMSRQGIHHGSKVNYLLEERACDRPVKKDSRSIKDWDSDTKVQREEYKDWMGTNKKKIKKTRHPERKRKTQCWNQKLIYQRSTLPSQTFSELNFQKSLIDVNFP